MTSHIPKNSYTKKTNKRVIFSILRHNLSKFVTQTGLYCSKQLETTFNQVGKKSLHIIFKPTFITNPTPVVSLLPPELPSRTIARTVSSEVLGFCL